MWARALAGWAEPGAKEAFALLHRESLELPGPDADRLAGIAREHGVWLVIGVNEVDPARPGTLYNSLLYYSPGGRAGTPPSQARADEPRAARLGAGRRTRAARDRDADRPARRTDLLGELHAAGAVLALRVGHRDLHRLDRRRRRLVAGDTSAHRPGVPRVRDRAVPLSAGELVPRRLSARVAARRPGHPRARRLGHARAGRELPRRDRSTTRRGSSTPSSIPTCCAGPVSASIRPVTTTGRTCSH